MIKVDIINEVAKAADITKVRAEVAVEAVLEAMKDSLMKGERIELRGFGVFQVKPRKRGIGRNPRTGKEVRIPPGPHDPLQARQGPAEPGPLEPVSDEPRVGSLFGPAGLATPTVPSPSRAGLRLGAAAALRCRRPARRGSAGDAISPLPR